MSVFDYNVTILPAPPISASGTLTASGSSLQIYNLALPAITVALSPTGNVAQWILSAILYPLAQTAALVAAPVAEAILSWKNDPVDVTSLSTTVNITSSDSVVVSATNLSLNGGGGYLTLSGGITLSAPST